MTRGMSMPEAQTFSKARKTGVVAMVERGGNVRAYVQPREGSLETVSQHIDPKATVYTDEWAGYRHLHSTHPAHLTIRHTDRVYASGDVHTQTIEGFFGNIKNGIAGTITASQPSGCSPTSTSTYGATNIAPMGARCSRCCCRELRTQRRWANRDRLIGLYQAVRTFPSGR